MTGKSLRFSSRRNHGFFKLRADVNIISWPLHPSSITNQNLSLFLSLSLTLSSTTNHAPITSIEQKENLQGKEKSQI